MNAYYVYQLVDPRNSLPFYVGKGKGKRMYRHEQQVMRGKIDNGAKCEIIRSILDSGDRVRHVVVAASLTESDAFALEKQMIEAMPSLTNIACGNVSAADSYRARCRTMLSRIQPFDQWVAQCFDDYVLRFIEQCGGFRVVYDEFVKRVGALASISDDDFSKVEAGRWLKV